MQIMSKCLSCNHLLKIRDSSKPFDVCEAFPNGIPREIWKGENNHHSPYPGDNGIVFEPIKEDN